MGSQSLAPGVAGVKRRKLQHAKMRLSTQASRHGSTIAPQMGPSTESVWQKSVARPSVLMTIVFGVRGGVIVGNCSIYMQPKLANLRQHLVVQYREAKKKK